MKSWPLPRPQPARHANVPYADFDSMNAIAAIEMNFVTLDMFLVC